jgi:hypothetical protein
VTLLRRLHHSPGTGTLSVEMLNDQQKRSKSRILAKNTGAQLKNKTSKAESTRLASEQGST